ncbi:MAG TPA: glycine zipper 2TM domain-containing protein [Caulobacteraceae bacterium]|jgi:hypothetical protein|nr:glycine zipper 2TM domain-containing protein [Caulobacteraceae bacterium]
MRNFILIAGLAAAVAAPSFAFGETRCERSRSDNRVLGTVAGGVLGALAGSAIASRHDSTAGILIGGTAGAVAGNQLAKGKPCPTGYVARTYPAPARTAYRAPARQRCEWRDQTYRDSYGVVTHRQVQVCR